MRAKHASCSPDNASSAGIIACMYVCVCILGQKIALQNQPWYHKQNKQANACNACIMQSSWQHIPLRQYIISLHSRPYVCMYTCTQTHTYIHAYIHTCIHACQVGSTSPSDNSSSAYILACMYACVYVCVCVYVHRRTHTYMHTYTHVGIHR